MAQSDAQSAIATRAVRSVLDGSVRTDHPERGLRGSALTGMSLRTRVFRAGAARVTAG
jgi:hypothetical protein